MDFLIWIITKMIIDGFLKDRLIWFHNYNVNDVNA